jgi:hypothetical protein
VVFVGAEVGTPAGGLAFSSADGMIYIADTGNHAVRRFDSSNLITLAGTGAAGFGEEGQLVDIGLVNAQMSKTQFDTPVAIAVNPATNDLFVGDQGNHRIRKIAQQIVPNDAGGSTQVLTSVLAGGGGTSAVDGTVPSMVGFNHITAVAFDTFHDVLYVTDGDLLRRVASNGATDTLAGAGGGAGGCAVRFNQASGVVVGGLNTLFVTDATQIWKLTLNSVAGDGGGPAS